MLRGWLRNLSLPGVASALSLLGAEGVARLLFPPSSEPQNLTTVGELTGDSFTFGAGVRVGDTFLAVLEERLRADCDPPIEVLNLGVGGGGTTDLFNDQDSAGVLWRRSRFAAHDGPELWVNSTDQHPNEIAHTIAGEALHRVLVSASRPRAR